MIYFFYTVAGLLLVQGVFSLIEGIRFQSLVRRSLREQLSPFKPKAAVIAPCKGIDAGLEQNLRRLFRQDYPDYEIVFALASNEDPARAIIEKVIAEHPAISARVIVAAPSPVRSEKVNNLLCGLDYVNEDCEVFAFVDSDARVKADWLASLASTLEDPRAGAATGYRWYIPERGGFFSAMLSAWNGSVATTLGEHDRNFAWGGSTAIRREVFDRTGVRQRWQRAVSDDYALTRAMQEAGLHIRFVPRCLVESREDASLTSLAEFTTRQITITRIYRPRMWWAGMMSHSLFCAVFFGGLVYALLLAFYESLHAPLLLMLGAIYILGSLKGLLRLLAARDALPDARRDISRLWWMFCISWPLVSLLFLYNFLKSATTRRITWRGVCYEMRSPADTVIVSSHRERAPDTAGSPH